MEMNSFPSFLPSARVSILICRRKLRALNFVSMKALSGASRTSRFGKFILGRFFIERFYDSCSCSMLLLVIDAVCRAAASAAGEAFAGDTPPLCRRMIRASQAFAASLLSTI